MKERFLNNVLFRI